MTATDPRPDLPRTPIRGLAAMLAERLAPAAEALALAYAEDMSAGPPPPDDRACAEYHRAARAQLAHLRQLLAVLDWAAARMPEPAEEPACETEEPREEPRPHVCDHDGGEACDGNRKTSGFKVWLADVERRFGPAPRDPDRPDPCPTGERAFTGDRDPPEYREWRDRHERRLTEELERLLDGDDPDDDANGAPRAQPVTPPAPAERHAPTPPHDKT